MLHNFRYWSFIGVPIITYTSVEAAFVQIMDLHNFQYDEELYGTFNYKWEYAIKSEHIVIQIK